MSVFFLACCLDQEVNAAPLQRFRGSALKGKGNTVGTVAPRVGVAHVPAHTSPCSAVSPPGAGPRRAAEHPRGLRSGGTGTSGCGGPGTLHRGSPQPGVERASTLQGGVSLLFFAVLSGEPRAAGLLPPRVWAAMKHPVTPSQAGDGHLGSQPPPPPPAPIFPVSSCP